MNTENDKDLLDTILNLKNNESVSVDLSEYENPDKFIHDLMKHRSQKITNIQSPKNKGIKIPSKRKVSKPMSSAQIDLMSRIKKPSVIATEEVAQKNNNEVGFIIRSWAKDPINTLKDGEGLVMNWNGEIIENIKSHKNVDENVENINAEFHESLEGNNDLPQRTLLDEYQAQQKMLDSGANIHTAISSVQRIRNRVLYGAGFEKLWNGLQVKQNSVQNSTKPAEQKNKTIQPKENPYKKNLDKWIAKMKEVKVPWDFWKLDGKICFPSNSDQIMSLLEYNFPKNEKQATKLIFFAITYMRIHNIKLNTDILTRQDIREAVEYLDGIFDEMFYVETPN